MKITVQYEKDAANEKVRGNGQLKSISHDQVVFTMPGYSYSSLENGDEIELEIIHHKFMARVIEVVKLGGRDIINCSYVSRPVGLIPDLNKIQPAAVTS